MRISNIFGTLILLAVLLAGLVFLLPGDCQALTGEVWAVITDDQGNALLTGFTTRYSSARDGSAWLHIIPGAAPYARAAAHATIATAGSSGPASEPVRYTVTAIESADDGGIILRLRND
jgi:hypothetical protein